MSIFKNEHSDNSSNFLIRLFALFFGVQCGSYIELPQQRNDIQPVRRCQLKKGHKGRHQDREMKWAYGEEFFK